MAEKRSPLKDWLIDSVIVLILAGVVVFILPLAVALDAEVSFRALPRGFGAFLPKLHLARIWIHPIDFLAFSDFPSHILIGSVIGLVAGAFLRHRRLWLAALPAALLCLIYVWHSSFGPDPYPSADSWRDFTLIADWLLFLATTLICARIMFHHRKQS